MMKTLFSKSMTYSLILGHKFPSTRPAIQACNRMLASHLYYIYSKRGVKAWEEFWIPAFREFGRVRADYIKKTMNIDPDSARSIGSYHDFEDPIFGVEGHWDNSSQDTPIRTETSCDMCDHLNVISKGKGCGDFCRYLVVAMEEGTGTAINDRYVVEVQSLLTEGDEDCRFVHKLKSVASEL